MNSFIIYNSRCNDRTQYKNTEEEQKCKLIYLACVYHQTHLWQSSIAVLYSKTKFVNPEIRGTWHYFFLHTF